VSHVLKIRMDGTHGANFVFYGTNNAVFDDDDWFAEMFLVLLEIEEMFEAAKLLQRYLSALPC
jgi:hypothetical protein